MFGSKPEMIDRTPSLEGPVSRAWLVDTNAFRAKFEVSPRNCALVASWVIEAPWAHPVWHSYWLMLQHLRPVDSIDPPVLTLDGATHQFNIFALDPEVARARFIAGDEPPAYLQPANFAAQMKLDSDEAAIAEMEKTIRLICNGKLSPDTDFMAQWIDLFGDNMIPPELRSRRVN